MSTTIAPEAGFIRDICANVADDFPRLAFADWLEDKGDADRAAFIRTQLELHGVYARQSRHDDYRASAPDYEAAMRLGGREAILFSNSLTWSGDLPKMFGIERPLILEDRPCALGSGPLHQTSVCWWFRRGFVAEIECYGNDWVRHGDAIRACQPIERVRLTTWPETNVSAPGNGIAHLSMVGRLDEVMLPEEDCLSVSALVSAFRALLAKCWPGIEFELPTTYDEVLARAVPWDEAPRATPLADFRRVLEASRRHSTPIGQPPEPRH
jgi:uncharacterized protein (TIGR02996 family)